MKINHDYRYVASSRVGFIQQVACSYVSNGYRFHVSGEVPARMEPEKLDEKLLSKYSIRKTDAQRYYAKSIGRANIQYIRFERDYLMLATKGEHIWNACEAGNIKDCSRGEPIQFFGYSIYWKDGRYRPYCCKRDREGPAEKDDKKRVRVQISRERFRELKAEFVTQATRRRAAWLATKLFYVPYEPYAPIRQQMLEIVHAINRKRKDAGMKDFIDVNAIRKRRAIVKPFETARHANTLEDAE